MLLTQLRRLLPRALRVIERNDVLDALNVLEQELTTSRDAALQQFVLFFGLNRANNLIVAPNPYEVIPKDRLAQLIRKGPENGMNFIVWANDPDANLRYYDDLLNAFDLRVMLTTDNPELYYSYLFQRKPADAVEGNAITYQGNADCMPIKLYSMPTPESLQPFAEQINARIEETV